MFTFFPGCPTKQHPCHRGNLRDLFLLILIIRVTADRAKPSLHSGASQSPAGVPRELSR